MSTGETGQEDPSRIVEPGRSTDSEIAFRFGLEKYFESSVGSNVEKLQNFTKYVPRQDLAIFLAKYEIFKKVLHVHGSIIECGVYLGGGLMTFAQLSAILEPVNHQRKIVGFDTFSGFRPLAKQDETGISQHSREGGFYVDSHVLEDLQNCVDLYDSNRFIGHIPKVSLVKGDIKETVPEYLKENPHTIVSLLYLDADVFEPTRVALEHFIPRMPKGAIIAFDELNHDGWPGESIALLETLGATGLRIRRFPFEATMSYAAID